MTSPAQIRTLIRAFPGVVQERLRFLWVSYRQGGPPIHPVYNQNASNEHGDVVSHLDLESDRPIEDMPFLATIDDGFNPGAVQALNAFYADMRGQATVYIILPAIPEYHYDRERAALDSIYGRLAEECTIPILAPPEAHVYPDDDFYDTAYHLGGEGRDRRARRVIRLLRDQGVGTAP